MGCSIIQNGFENGNNRALGLWKNKSILNEYILNFPLEYKGIITENRFDYGIEIEFKGAILEVVEDKLLEKYNTNELVYKKDWVTKVDETVTQYMGYYLGGEAVSPICENRKNDWIELEEMCNLIKEESGYIDESCGLHVHFDLGILGYDEVLWTKFLSLWAIYEDVLYQFAVGDQMTLRRDAKEKYASSIRSFVQDSCIYNTPIWEHPALQDGKSYGVNLENLKEYFDGENFSLRTIEFRIANGSLDPIVIQNIVRTYYKMLIAVKEHNPVLDYYLSRHEDILYDVALPEYQESEFDMACELTDIIFDNNEDKLSFMKQYMEYLPKDSKQYIK